LPAAGRTPGDYEPAERAGDGEGGKGQEHGGPHAQRHSLHENQWLQFGSMRMSQLGSARAQVREANSSSGKISVPSQVPLMQSPRRPQGPPGSDCGREAAFFKAKLCDAVGGRALESCGDHFVSEHALL